MEYIIKKLGGENAAEIHKSAQNIFQDYERGVFQAVVVSAIRTSSFNTTDKLIELGKLFQSASVDKTQIHRIIVELEQFHLNILSEKLIDVYPLVVDLVKTQFILLQENVEAYLSQDHKTLIPHDSNDYSLLLPNNTRFSILGFGETLSAKIISCVVDSLSSNNICSKSIDLSNLIQADEIGDKSTSEIFDILSLKIGEIVEYNVLNGHIPIIGGYIGSFEHGIEQAIGRGYTDSTASICTVGLSERKHDVILEVQKSVPGLMSADPRLLEDPKKARVIESLDYLTAREITGDSGAQAKLLHHQTLNSRVQEAGVRVHLFDPFSKTSHGSWIEPTLQKKGNSADSGVEFIGARSDIIFFSISSGKMFEKNILGRLFSIVKDYFSIDIVSTSETEITFTIDGCGECDKKLNEMISKITQEFSLHDKTSMEFVEYRKDRALLFLVGGNMRNHIGLMARATKVLAENDINIKMVSQGRLQRAMVFGIRSDDMKKALNMLHDEFIN
ncbi:ACT domain-containing protein [Candidatus Gracilibacteria bacterium]|nr:ACT domain-containing protein [Candidatus Gracilibacteria bacterium]